MIENLQQHGQYFYTNYCVEVFDLGLLHNTAYSSLRTVEGKDSY